jgi:hypothetical protein
MAVAHQKEFNRHKGRALVAINEGMVARQAKTVGRSKLGKVRLTVVRQVLRPRHRRIEQTTVANASSATVFGQLFVVHSQQHVAAEPDPRFRHHYFASSRKTLRRAFMITRAASICVSNSSL